MTGSVRPIWSTAHAVTVYVTPFASLVLGNATLHEVVPVATTVAGAVCHALPVQYWLLFDRRIVIRTLATPDPWSAAVPQRSVVAEQPADQPEEL